MKHHETLEQSSFDATISALDAETSALDVETSAFGAATSAIAQRSSDATISALDAETSALDAETSAIARRSSDATISVLDAETSAIARSYRRYRRGVSGDIGDCGVGITPQMCNRVTPVSIQDGVQHGITFAAISTIPAELSPNSAELSPIPGAIGGRAVADRCATR